MNHTPGPWECEPYSSDSDEPINVVSEYVKSPDGQKVANWIAECSLESDREQNQANASLIAAAPDLLAVARFVVQATTGNIPPGIVQAAKEAIAKATS